MKCIVVIPAYKAADSIRDVAKRALDFCHKIVVVDDGCPDGSGDVARSLGSRVIVLRRDENGGVGAAMKTGIAKALDLGADVIVKVDADGQMDPSLIPQLIQSIERAEADFSKGTRFDTPEDLEAMPKLRLAGNSALTLINKFSSGYWSINDPTNGFIAISGNLAKQLQWQKISDGYFFESDLLFRARLIGARISQMRMPAVYKGERSHLRPMKVIFPFVRGHFVNLSKRLIYMYFVREWNLGTIYFVSSLIALGVGLTASYFALEQSSVGSVGTGTAVLASLGYILWVQFVSQFLTVDLTSEPKSAK